MNSFMRDARPIKHLLTVAKVKLEMIQAILDALTEHGPSLTTAQTTEAIRALNVEPNLLYEAFVALDSHAERHPHYKLWHPYLRRARNDITPSGLSSLFMEEQS